MKIYKFLLIFLLIIRVVYGQDTLTFSLSEAIKYGLDNSVEVKNSYVDTKIAKEQIKETLASGFPQINFKANFTDNISIKNFFADSEPDLSNIDPNLIKGLEEFFPDLPKFNTEMSVAIEQLIFDGKYFVGLKAASTIEDASETKYQITKTQTTASIAKSYYTVLVNKKLIELAKHNFQRLDTLLRQTQIMYQNGFVEKIDVQRIKVSYNNAKNEFDLSQRDWYISKEILKHRMAVPTNMHIILTDELHTEGLEKSLKKNIDNFDFNKRLEYKNISEQIELQGYVIKGIKVEYFPTLYFSGEYGYNSLSSEFSQLGNWSEYFNYGFKLKFPIFDGLRKKSRISQEKFTLEKMQNQRKNLERTILIEQLQAKSLLLSSINTLDVQRENMELAKYIYQVSKTKYQQGLATNQEVIDSETAYKKAESDFYRAVFSALSASIDYHLATGDILENIE